MLSDFGVSLNSGKCWHTPYFFRCTCIRPGAFSRLLNKLGSTFSCEAYEWGFILYFTVKTNVYQNLIKLVFSLIWNFTDIKSHWYQKSLVTDISLYRHCRFWITSDVSIYLTSLNVSHFRNSNAYKSVIYERKHKVWVFIFLVRT